MVNYQEAQLGQSFEQVAKFFADKTASREEVNQAFSRLIRLENCIRTVTERIRAMAEKLESVEEAKSARPDRLATLLENIVSWFQNVVAVVVIIIVLLVFVVVVSVMAVVLVLIVMVIVPL
ncbi:unnamed protein product, partial [Dibothriocephalus latus]